MTSTDNTRYGGTPRRLLRSLLRSLENTRTIAIGFVLGGFALIVLGWYGAARLDHTPGQIPYLISGGIGGLAMVIAGLGLLLIDELRRERGTTVDEIDASHNGGRPTRVSGSAVVIGPNVYHRRGCRLIAGRDLPVGTTQEAAERGLEPCRVCSPGGRARSQRMAQR